MDDFSTFTSLLLESVGFVVGLVGVILSIILYRKSAFKKTLSYGIISQNPLIALPDDILERIEISFQGELVANVRLIALKLQNSGNVSIIPDDFISPLDISFGDNTNILSHTVTETSPENIHLQIQAHNSHITIKPLLLNPGDSFVITFLVDQFSGNVYVSARIQGVKQISEGALS